MNWDAMPAVGEIVIAVTVVGTLGYLALQIRHSTNESTANSELVYEPPREYRRLISLSQAALANSCSC